jgi:hypothetical protein
VERYIKWSLVAPFLLGIETGKPMNDQWKAIVSEALTRGVKESKGAVPGAKLRQLIAETAVQHGHVYPPAGFENKSFGEFLKFFDSILVVLRRKAQDTLVAPSDQPTLLINDSGSSLPQLRIDIFEAFTHIARPPDRKEPWYDKTRDDILWLNPEDPKDEATMVPVTPGTKERELEDRRTFAESSEIDPGTRVSLLRSLEEGGQSVLWAFAQIIRSARLSRKWHVFRFRQLTARIRAWCEVFQVSWREEWLVTGEEVVQRISDTATATALASETNGRDFRRGRSASDFSSSGHCLEAY